MKRTITISEEFGRWWKAETSAGHLATGATPTIALTNLLVAAGVDMDEGYEPIARMAGNRLSEIFELVLPKQEGRPDVPASTVR